MAVDLASIQTGMDVLDPTNDKIGTIDDVLNVQGYTAVEDAAMAADPMTDTVSDLQTTTVTRNPSGEQTYLKVKHGGVLGLGATDLYIPMSAVQRVIPGDSVTVGCSKDTCADMYGTKPATLP